MCSDCAALDSVASSPVISGFDPPGLAISNSVDPRITMLRQKVAEECLAFAKAPRGIYRLTVPTGGGKTFSALRFAFAHAQEVVADHIFYIAPFLTIIDQNVRDVREALNMEEGDQSRLLEYHSNVLRNSQARKAAEEKAVEKPLPSSPHWGDLLAERFEAPIIFTTLVQFLNSFYESGTKSIRRLHQFSNSIIIFDEAQAVPFRCIHLFNMALNFLADTGKSTIILCTATQPALEKTDRPLIAAHSGEMMRDVNALYQGLQRTELADSTKEGGYTISELAEFVWEKVELEGNGLIILNKKRQVRELYEKIRAMNDALEEMRQFEVYHLSTSMCAQHRLDTLEKVQKCLAEDRKVVCVSTQLIEAGVNISFRCVIRSLAGLDSVAQAAGRCNRHGEMGGLKKVYVVNISGEDLSKLEEIRLGAQEASRVMREFRDFHDFSDFGTYFPELKNSFQDGLLSPKVMELYFQYYYKNGKRAVMDFPVKCDLSDVSVVSLLSENFKCTDAYRDKCNRAIDLEMKQAHRTAAEAFYVIPEGNTGVITPYGGGKEIIAQLNGTLDLSDIGGILKEAQRYMVTLYEWEFQKLDKNQDIVSLCNGEVFALRQRAYDSEMGVDLEGAKMDSMFF